MPLKDKYSTLYYTAENLTSYKEYDVGTLLRCGRKIVWGPWVFHSTQSLSVSLFLSLSYTHTHTHKHRHTPHILGTIKTDTLN
jgi:hypothetical protein